MVTSNKAVLSYFSDAEGTRGVAGAHSEEWRFLSYQVQQYPGPRRLPCQAAPEAKATPEVTTLSTRPSREACGLDSGPAQPSRVWTNPGLPKLTCLAGARRPRRDRGGRAGAVGGS